MEGVGLRFACNMEDYLPESMRSSVERIQQDAFWMDCCTGPAPGPEDFNTLFFTSGKEYVRLDDGAFEILPGIGRAPVKDADGERLLLFFCSMLTAPVAGIWLLWSGNWTAPPTIIGLFSLFIAFLSIKRCAWILSAAFMCRPRVVFSYSRQTVFLVRASGSTLEIPFSKCRLGIYYPGEDVAHAYNESGGLFVRLPMTWEDWGGTVPLGSEGNEAVAPPYGNVLLSAWGKSGDVFDYPRLLGLHNFIRHYMAYGTQYIFQDIPDVGTARSSAQETSPVSRHGLEYFPPQDVLRHTRPYEDGLAASLKWLAGCAARIPFGSAWFAWLKCMYAPLPSGLTEKLYVPRSAHQVPAYAPEPPAVEGLLEEAPKEMPKKMAEALSDANAVAPAPLEERAPVVENAEGEVGNLQAAAMSPVSEI